MALYATDWRDEYISENYPDAMILAEESTGEIVICLGAYV